MKFDYGHMRGHDGVKNVHLEKKKPEYFLKLSHKKLLVIPAEQIKITCLSIKPKFST